VLALSAAEGFADAARLRAQARELAAACQEHGVRLLLAGRGPWPDPTARRAPFERARDFRELHGLLAGLPALSRHG
jgi:hypothetical protein